MPSQVLPETKVRIRKMAKMMLKIGKMMVDSPALARSVLPEMLELKRAARTHVSKAEKRVSSQTYQVVRSMGCVE